MTLRDLKDIEKDDILKRLGLQSRTSTSGHVLGTLGVFGLGLLVGSSLALIMAPKSGRELRSDISHRLRRREEPLDGQALEGTL